MFIFLYIVAWIWTIVLFLTILGAMTYDARKQKEANMSAKFYDKSWML